MQKEPFQSPDLRFDYTSKKTFVTVWGIKIVTNYRVANVSEVNTDLMCSAGFRENSTKR